MGNAACCNNVDFGAETALELSFDTETEPSDEQYTMWMRKYEEGDSVEVLFPDKKVITCVLTVSSFSSDDSQRGRAQGVSTAQATGDKAVGHLSLAYGEKVRTIRFSEIGGIVTKDDSMDAAEASPLLSDTKVVGLKLLKSGKAIALRFPTETDTLCFTKFIGMAIA